jgi:23S rRNA (cytidine1920-2'-O)/16S rRNA (cytidine1409-2'-O)-methyltransferase
VTSKRLDEELLRRGLLQSRSRARDAVLRGIVQINGNPARKPSQPALATDHIELQDDSARYVSRAALKLLHGLDYFSIGVKGRHCLDLGASTGGFTQVLLERGAEHVVAVDVGHGQMAQSLLQDPRITLHEGLNARDLTRDIVPETISLVVCDVSFISLKLALPAALALVASGTWLVALIKPQFEVGRDHVGKGGLVTDETQHKRACDEVTEFLQTAGWRINGLVPSPLEGGDGNREFLVFALKQ